MFLGVDGGGTKTAYALIDADGHVRARHVGRQRQPSGRGFRARGSSARSKASAPRWPRRRSRPARPHLCLHRPASYGEDSAATPRLDAMPAQLLDAARYRCGNDMICSWAGSLGLRDGISVIAGTGSMAYGEYARPHGARRRVGRADRRRRLRLLDRARGHESVLAHERRPRRARSAACAGARAAGYRGSISICARTSTARARTSATFSRNLRRSCTRRHRPAMRRRQRSSDAAPRAGRVRSCDAPLAWQYRSPSRCRCRRAAAYSADRS